MLWWKTPANGSENVTTDGSAEGMGGIRYYGYRVHSKLRKDLDSCFLIFSDILIKA